MQRDPRVRLVNHDKPGGIGAAFWDGVAHARGDVVCLLPGDNENDPWEILRYHRLMEHVDILIPFVFNKEARSLFRNGLSYVFRFIINTTFLVNFNYTNGTVMYRKKLLAEVPYRLDVRPHGVSKAVSFPSLMRVMKGYLPLVRDVYFSGERNATAEFATGSQTARRHGGEPAPKAGAKPAPVVNKP